MRQQEFEEHVTRALDGLPPLIQERMENVEVLVAQWATREQLVASELSSRYQLLGLYEGIPLPERSTQYGMVLPDRITIFQGAVEAMCRSEEQLEGEIRRTVVHEVAHHFGIDDDQLRAMGY
ncbi:MAG: metallopeptidase family protein [Dehalococcoidia bacterium]